MTVEKRGNSFFVILNKKEARKTFINSNIEICRLYDDNSESVIHTRQDLELALYDNEVVGVYIGESNK